MVTGTVRCKMTVAILILAVDIVIVIVTQFENIFLKKHNFASVINLSGPAIPFGITYIYFGYFFLF